MPFQTNSVWWTTLAEEDRRQICEVSDQSVFTQPDLLVIGDGIVGLATAYFAAERGLQVQLISDSTHLASDANETLGDIFPNAIRWRLSPLAQPLAQASRDWWAKLAVRPGFQLDWRVTGALMVDESHLSPNPRQVMMALLEEGYSVRDVDVEQVALLETHLRSLPAGGLQFPSEAVLHPLKAAAGLIRGIRQFRGRITTGLAIEPLVWDGGTLREVRTSSDVIRPRNVVIDHSFQDQNVGETGSTVQNLLGEQVERRTFLATAPLPPCLTRPVLHKSWIQQLKSGEIVVETTGSGDSGDSASGVRNARELIPCLQQVSFVHSWSTEILTNPELLPTIERLNGSGNTWVYGCLTGAQVILAPILGRHLVDWISTDSRPDELLPLAK